MASLTQTARAPKWMYWTGWILSILPSLMLVMSAVMKFVKPDPVTEGIAKLGWDENKLLALGIVEITCTLIYLFPRTSILGAILLTGYLGGATATHVRVDDVFIAPIILGVVLWLGLWLRCGRLRALVPLRS